MCPWVSRTAAGEPVLVEDSAQRERTPADRGRRRSRRRRRARQYIAVTGQHAGREPGEQHADQSPIRLDAAVDPVGVRRFGEPRPAFSRSGWHTRLRALTTGNDGGQPRCPRTPNDARSRPAPARQQARAPRPAGEAPATAHGGRGGDGDRGRDGRGRILRLQKATRRPRRRQRQHRSPARPTCCAAVRISCRPSHHRPNSAATASTRRRRRRPRRSIRPGPGRCPPIRPR